MDLSSKGWLHGMCHQAPLLLLLLVRMGKVLLVTGGLWCADCGDSGVRSANLLSYSPAARGDLVCCRCSCAASVPNGEAAG